MTPNIDLYLRKRDVLKIKTSLEMHSPDVLGINLSRLKYVLLTISNQGVNESFA